MGASGVLHGRNVPALRDLFRADAGSRPPAGDETWDAIPPVWSGGLADRPRLALVFINPTAGNQAARDGWPAEYRAPHLGRHRMWDFLTGCGLIPRLIVPPDGEWTLGVARNVCESAAYAGLYVTNLVKACRTTAAMPTARYARGWLPLLREELGIVDPERVVTMGGLVTSLLLGKPFRVGDAWRHLETTRTVLELPYCHPGCEPRGTGGGCLRIVPSYFPSGRGVPARARAIISMLAETSG